GHQGGGAYYGGGTYYGGGAYYGGGTHPSGWYYPSPSPGRPGTRPGAPVVQQRSGYVSGGAGDTTSPYYYSGGAGTTTSPTYYASGAYYNSYCSFDNGRYIYYYSPRQ